MTRRLLQTRWRVPARIEAVANLLSDVERLPEWWGAVYLAVRIVAPGDESGVGRRVRFHTRGWLPYTLRWEGEIICADHPHGWTIAARGDLEGQGDWTLRQDGDTADICYEWNVEVGKPMLRPLAPLLWPLFAANHRWAMARGFDGLCRELGVN